MPAASAGLAREMQVPADHLDPVKRIRKAESDQSPKHVLEIANALLSQRLDQSRIWTSLPGDRANAHVLEAAIDPDRNRTRRPLQPMPDGLAKRVVLHRPSQRDRRS